MYIETSKFKTKSGKIYSSTLLRQSYREGKKVKKRTIANLSKCSPDEIEAIKLALKHKLDLANLGSFDESVKCQEGLSVGAVWTVLEVAKRLGIVNALGSSRDGKLALWQVIARVIDQGSRLSAVRLANTHAMASAIGIEKGFNEDALYQNLAWLNDNQERIEQKLFKLRKEQSSNLFLYDVTSSYLEGDKNELADWGYNRDKKKGKKQIVVGLLCDDEGEPISTEIFKGNTSDLTTFYSQIEKAKKRFGCEKVTFVGDRGMIKRTQIKALEEHGFQYITAISKKEIETLIKKDHIQLEFFSKELYEVELDGVRYILRKNPRRAEELDQNRVRKRAAIKKLILERNQYLEEHPKAKVETAVKTVNAKIKKLKVDGHLSLETEERTLVLKLSEEKLKEESRLDGCYIIKTDLKQSEADKQVAHDRYKDLAFVESAFRTSKSTLELRPVHVRTAESTHGHVFVVMMAYMIMKNLDMLWKGIDTTVAEGLKSLSTLTTIEVTLNDQTKFEKVPEPRAQNRALLGAAGVSIPKIIPRNDAHVATKKQTRKSAKKT